MSNFQIGIIVAFILFIVAGVLLFTGVLPGFKSSGGGFGGTVEVWGTIPEEKMRPLVDDVNKANKNSFSIIYEEKDKRDFDTKLVEALAAGDGPDIFMLPQDYIEKQKDKIFAVPFDSISKRAFKDAFIEEGELYFTDDGILAMPFTVDPLVMYWNRDILSGAGVARSPEFWDEFLKIAPLVTKRDAAENVVQSAVALGEFANITNAKDIVSALILQTGNTITGKKEGKLGNVLTSVEDKSAVRAESALRFYTEFANSAKPSYSWNRSLPESRDMFIAGELAVYFGYASELPGIIAKNPHLNFDIAPLPQIRDNNIKLTFGKMNGWAIAKNSDNVATAAQVAGVLSGSGFADGLSRALKLPPVRRDLLSVAQTDAYNTVFYKSALMSKAWLDPNPEKTYNIFKDAIDGITSGRFRISEAVSNMSAEIEELVR